MKTSLACTSLLVLLVMAGCTIREPVYSRVTVDPASLPEVLCYDPSPAFLTAPPDTSIGLFFSVPMRPDSVLAAITVEENSSPLDVYSGFAQWEAGYRLLLWQPPTGYSDGSTVSVSVKTTAESESGLHLVEPVSWSFQASAAETDPGGAPAPTVLSPGLDSVAPLDQQVILQFDRKVLRSTVEASFVLRSLDLQDIRTARDGDLSWKYTAADDIRAVFTPHDDLHYGKTYEVVVNDNGALCRDMWSNEYTGSFSHSFFSIHNAIYVSDNLGTAGNEGYHPLTAMSSITDGIQKAQEHGLTLVRIEGQGAAPDYPETVTVPGGITLEGGWDETFTDHDSWSYPTDITAPAGEQYAVIIKSASNVEIRHLSCTGGTVSGSENGALLVDDSITIKIISCRMTGSTASPSGTVSGIVVLDSSFVTIENNTVYAGTSSGFSTFGIRIDNSEDVVIRGNGEIHGGAGVDSDTTGIQVIGGSRVNIYRNFIRGGASSIDASNTGIYFYKAGECNVYNNSITGGTMNTDQYATCYGIRATDTELNIINNTVHGGGRTNALNENLGNDDCYAINISNNPWTISPIIVNNIVFGGNSMLSNYGIRFQCSSCPVTACIFNNTFSVEKCTSYVLISTVDHASITEVNGSAAAIPSPFGNLDFIVGDILFADEPNNDYHISSSTPDLVDNNGSDFTSPQSLVDELEEAGGLTADLLTDIDGNPRDRYSIDRGAHEAYP